MVKLLSCCKFGDLKCMLDKRLPALLQGEDAALCQESGPGRRKERRFEGGKGVGPRSVEVSLKMACLS